MINLKEKISQLPENERMELAQELIQTLSEANLNRLLLDMFSVEGKVEKELSGEEMKAWIRQQIAESESRYATQMKEGEVKTYTLAELKAELDG